MVNRYIGIFPTLSRAGLNPNPDRDLTDLKLSDAQRKIFAGWKRPRETALPLDKDTDVDEAFMVCNSEIDLVQDITTDCSVVASLCAGTARALKGHGNARETHHIACY